MLLLFIFNLQAYELAVRRRQEFTAKRCAIQDILQVSSGHRQALAAVTKLRLDCEVLSTC